MKKFSVPQYGQPEHIATDWMTEYGEKIIPIIEPIIRIQRIDNPHLAFGLDAGIFSVIITPLTVLLTILIGYYLYKSSIDLESKVKSLSLSLILGGAFGNLFDRLLNGKVVDFISLGITDEIRWNYIFNIADSFITIGMILLLSSDFLFKKTKENEIESS